MVKRQSHWRAVAWCRPLPGVDFVRNRCGNGHTAVETLPAEHTKRNLGDVAPVAMVGGVVGLLIIGQPLGLGGCDDVIQGAGVWVLRSSVTNTLRSASE